MKNYLIVLTIAFIAFNTYAEAKAKPAAKTGGSSEFFHQPSGSEFELTPALLYQMMNIKYKNTTLEGAKTNSWVPSVTGQYGITENYSLGLMLSYISSETSVEPSTTNSSYKSTGLANPEILFVAYNDLGPGSIRYGATFSLSLEKNRFDSRDRAGNASSGGNTLMPYVGYEWNAGQVIVGARVAYDLYKGERDSENTATNGTVSTTKTKNGESTYLHLFGEIPVDDSDYGLAFIYTDTVETKTSTNGAAEVNNRNSSQSYAGRLYAQIPVSGVELLPSLMYQTSNLNNGPYSNFIDSVATWQFKFGARFGF